MDLSDLRLHALRQAADDTRAVVAGCPVHAAPEIITARASAYLDFLLNGLPPLKKQPAPKADKKAKKRS